MFERKYSFDVVVAGGGIAGIAASVASARAGAKTLLLEKSFTPGGLATSGLINIFLPLCDGNGTQITFGITEELMHLSMKYGPGTIPADWMKKKNAEEVERLRCVFSPGAMILALDEILEKSGVEVWFDTLLTNVKKDDDGCLQSVFVENYDGRSEICAKSYIDATGTARLSALAEEELLHAKNVLSLWALEYEGKRLPGRDRMAPEINMLTLGNPDRTFSAPTTKDASDYMKETRAFLRKFYIQEYAENGYDRFTRWPLVVSSTPQFRKIAAVTGSFLLDSAMNNTFFEDSIGVVSDWRKSGPVWEIPFATLRPLKTSNLFTAGRCISSVGDAWEITRCIPCAALTGEAVGNAAALFASGMRTGLTEGVQNAMERNGNKLHI